MALAQRGNALFLILIAVALFAALSYAVTQSGRGGAKGIDKEKTILGAAQLTQIGANLQTAVTRMRASGTALADIDLHEDAGQGDAGTDFTPCTAGANCIFAPDGGGLPVPTVPQHIDKGADNPNKPHIQLYELDGDRMIDGVANNEAVLIMYVWNVNEDACNLVNQGLGISGMPASVGDPSGGTPFDVAPGHAAACWKNGTTDPQQYVYYHVIGEP